MAQAQLSAQAQGALRESFEPVVDAGHAGGGLVTGTHTPPPFRDTPLGPAFKWGAGAEPRFPPPGLSPLPLDVAHKGGN